MTDPNLHNLCDKCWLQSGRGSNPRRVLAPDMEFCCKCGAGHCSGIYYRGAPNIWGLCRHDEHPQQAPDSTQRRQDAEAQEEETDFAPARPIPFSVFGDTPESVQKTSMPEAEAPETTQTYSSPEVSAPEPSPSYDAPAESGGGFDSAGSDNSGAC